MAMLTPVELILYGLANAYLALVAKTARVDLENIDAIRDGQVVGYWHEDSLSLFVLLRRWKERPQDISVIITADWRGNLLERLLKKAGAKAIRVADGAGVRHAYETLNASCRERKKVVASAMDGPLGPRRVPKRLLFHLAGQHGREMTILSFSYQGVIRLKRRWDHYVLPMPFCRMVVRVHPLGKIDPKRAKTLMTELKTEMG